MHAAYLLLPVLNSALPALRHEQVQSARVVIVSGSADHMEQVMGRAKVDYALVRPDQLPELPLHSQQVLMVNCRGVMSKAARERVRRFVNAGGFLYTTDHAVHELVEKIFPNTIQYNGKTTKQRVLSMTTSGERGLLHKLGRSASQRWQLAPGGYLFDILDKDRVEVLMRAERYGALGVRFRYGDGVVIHVTGHFFTQPGQRAEDAGAFEQLSSNVVSEKIADDARIERLYNRRAKGQVSLQAAPKPDAPAKNKLNEDSRLKVIQKKKNFVKVRDNQGNEGWINAASLEE